MSEGRPYFLRGRVVHGRGLGRRLGVPTANLKTGPDKLPPRGVYKVRVRECGPGGGRAGRSAECPRARFPSRMPSGSAPRPRPVVIANARIGVCNIGVRPTVEASGRRHIEVHIPNFSGELYGRTLQVEFLRRLRGERRFKSLDALKLQIARDVRRALA